MRLTNKQFRALPNEVLSDTGATDMRRIAQTAGIVLTEREEQETVKLSKFRNIPLEVDGIRFDSKAEVKRYLELKLLEQTGEISQLRLQPVYKLFDKFTDKFGRKHRESVYTGDFAYVENGQEICEDTKGGTATMVAIWRLKWKMAIRAYPDIRFEVTTVYDNHLR
ncbi:MAG: hypothetical protein DDT21_02301 [Syntrophomonadaceae bacterium]|nr:hypothetical protein [Bacillota bacterium]